MESLQGKVSEHAHHPIILSHYGSQKGGVCGVQFRANMKHLVSGGCDNLVYLWSMHCRPNLRHPVVRPYRYAGHQGPVYAVAVCPLDNYVASASKDKSIRLWIPTVEGKSSVIKGHTGPVRTVNFSKDGRWILSGSDDKTVKIWQVSTHRFVCALSGHLNWVKSAEFNNNSRQVVSGSDDRTIRLWDVETHQCVVQFPDVLGEVNSVRFHPENNCIASGSSSNCIQMWDTRSKSLIQHYAANAGSVYSVSFHPAGNYMLSSCEDATLKIWDLREGQIMFALQGHDGSVKTAEFSPTGEFFASGSTDEHVVLWRTNVDLTGGGQQGNAMSNIVRKNEVGHSSCKACNCLCTSATQENNISHENNMLHEETCCDFKDTIYGRKASSRPSSAYKVNRPRPQSPPEEYNGSSSDYGGERESKIKSKKTRGIKVKIHKFDRTVDIRKSTETYEPQKGEPYALNEEHLGREESPIPSDFVCDMCEEEYKREKSNSTTSYTDAKNFAKENASTMPDNKIGSTLEQIWGQLNVFTRTIALFDERISHFENKVVQLERRLEDEPYNNDDKSSLSQHPIGQMQPRGFTSA